MNSIIVMLHFNYVKLKLEQLRNVIHDGFVICQSVGYRETIVCIALTTICGEILQSLVFVDFGSCLVH